MFQAARGRLDPELVRDPQKTGAGKESGADANAPITESVPTDVMWSLQLAVSAAHQGLSQNRYSCLIILTFLGSQYPQ
jgi:hypothetical protein